MVLIAQSAAVRCAVLIAALLPAAASADPFPTRDQNPLLAGFGMPMPLPAKITDEDRWSLAADFNWGSTASIEQAPGELLILDAESRELRITAGRSFAERWKVQLQLPYRYTGGGTLDSFIDGWHDFFSMPEGERPILPQDQFRIAYARSGSVAIDRRTAGSGIGDISADLGYQWLSTENNSLAAWLSVKLPSGDPDKFNGSGATDVALSLAGKHRFSQRWSVFGQASATWLGEGDLLPEQQRDVVWNAMAGTGYNIWRGLELKLQLDAHTGAFEDSSIDFFGDTFLLTFGGTWHFRSGWQFDVGVSEDILLEGSPDVVFVFGLRGSL